MWLTKLGRMFTPTTASPQDEYKPRFKVVMVGDSGVGKTNLLRRHVHNQFADDHLPTIGIEFGLAHHTVDGMTAAIANVWDTPGLERLGRSLESSYLKGPQGILLVYDVSCRATFESLTQQLDGLRKHVTDDTAVMLVGNKIDLDREVSTQEGMQFAAEHDVQFIEVSSKTGDNVKEAFSTLLEAIYRDRYKEPAR